MNKYLLTLLFFSILQSSTIFAQKRVAIDSSSKEIKLQFSAYEGIVVVSYDDNGGFLNFTGPSIDMKYKQHKIIFGMLPSLRFKEDNSKIKDSFVMPVLGFGLTYCYKKFAMQVPLYYEPKTAVNNGRWVVGIGVGMKLN